MGYLRFLNKKSFQMVEAENMSALELVESLSLPFLKIARLVESYLYKVEEHDIKVKYKDSMM
jgi:hypothetical protein